MSVQWHRLEAHRVLPELKSSTGGLTGSDAQQRLVRYGPNELQEKKKRGPVFLFLAQFRSTLVIILIAAVVFSALIGEFLDAAVILIILITNAALGFIQEYRAERAISALKKLTMPESVVIRDGKQQKIKSSVLVPGDVVLLEEGDKIPADMRLLETTELTVDESSLTGESVPVLKQTNPVGDVPVADQRSMVFRGTHVAYGRGKAVVTSTGMQTEMGRIAHLIQDAGEHETPLQKRLAVFGRRLGILILAISLVVIGVGMARGLGVLDMILTGIALAVAAIPEGLPAVVTITLALALQRLSQRNAIVRRLPAVETLGSTSLICADKTGTLTKNEMTVQKVFSNDRIVDVTGKGYQPVGEFLADGAAIAPDSSLRLLATVSSLCTNATVNGDVVVGDPTEAALIVVAEKAGLRKPELEKRYPRLGEVPFSSERKMMATMHQDRGKVLVCVKGAAEMVLQKCTRIHHHDRVRALTAKDRQRILQVTSACADQALRVLAVAYKGAAAMPERPEEDLVFLGLVGMIDPPRDGVREQIALCRQAGIQVVMITGDHRNTAMAVARQIGLLDSGQAMTGEDLKRLSEQELDRVIEQTVVYARVNPEDKVRILEGLRKKGHIVAMTGDGVNDAPALKRADIGVAMGMKGTEVAKEASDMILADDNFASIVAAVEGGRHVYDNITKFILYLLSSNMGEVLVVLGAMVLGLPLPLVAVQLLWMNLITDGLPAIALGTEPPEPDIMKRRPRDPQQRILDRETVQFIGLIGVIMLIGTIGVFYLSLTSRGWMAGESLDPGSPVYVYAISMSFTTLVMFQLFNVLNTRSLRHSLVRLGFWSNKNLLLAILVSLLMQLAVLYAPPLQPLFMTTALSAVDWLLILGVAASVLLLVQTRIRIKEGVSDV